ncbi:MAG: hypothetical protein N2204_09135 [Anaerolineae bacterium]|nr:hypothetical protein [Anaerolineae bacterium]
MRVLEKSTQKIRQNSRESAFFGKAGAQTMPSFDRLLKVGLAAGFIPDAATAIFDTTATGGAGIVMDACTLPRKGICKLLKAAGFALPGQRQGPAPAWAC